MVLTYCTISFFQLPGETKIGLKLHSEITVLTEVMAWVLFKLLLSQKKSQGFEKWGFQGSCLLLTCTKSSWSKIKCDNNIQEIKLPYVWENYLWRFTHWSPPRMIRTLYIVLSLIAQLLNYRYDNSDICFQGLFTLSTVIVDYRGYRVIAQSIIPGKYWYLSSRTGTSDVFLLFPSPNLFYHLRQMTLHYIPHCMN